MEHVVYDRDSAQLLTSSFIDYAIPRAGDLPSFRTDFIETPAPSNPLCVKGGSESGTIGAPAAIGNAVFDALWHLGVRDISLPMTAETVWRAITGAKVDMTHKGNAQRRLHSNDRHVTDHRMGPCCSRVLRYSG